MQYQINDKIFPVSGWKPDDLIHFWKILVVKTNFRYKLDALAQYFIKTNGLENATPHHLEDGLRLKFVTFIENGQKMVFKMMFKSRPVELSFIHSTEEVMESLSKGEIYNENIQSNPEYYIKEMLDRDSEILKKLEM
jgi:hypothetical protein